jgi:hypothetical protein
LLPLWGVLYIHAHEAFSLFKQIKTTNFISRDFPSTLEHDEYGEQLQKNKIPLKIVINLQHRMWLFWCNFPTRRKIFQFQLKSLLSECFASDRKIFTAVFVSHFCF